MFHHCPRRVPGASCRGQKGIPYTYGVSPQQLETGQLLQHPGPADLASIPNPVAGFACSRPPVALDVSAISAHAGLPAANCPLRPRYPVAYSKVVADILQSEMLTAFRMSSTARSGTYEGRLSWPGDSRRQQQWKRRRPGRGTRRSALRPRRTWRPT